MDHNELDILLSGEARELIERHIGDDPGELALRLRNPAVTRQIGVLQKCRTKLPSYYAARCIVPGIAYEQSSSESTARSRTEGLSGELAVDLTCGLGVDTLALSRKFRRVISVEADPARAEIARHNFRRLGAENVEVVAMTAEEFMGRWQEMLPQDGRADLIYADPSRKTTDGKRVYSLEQSSPDVLELMPLLRRRANRIQIKLSPLFDVAEIYRLLGPDIQAGVISLDGECKEVIADTGGPGGAMELTVIRGGVANRYLFREFTPDTASFGKLDPLEASFLYVPDVAFYKARMVGAYLREYFPDAELRAEDYVFSREPLPGFEGTGFRILSVHPYQPKQIVRLLKEQGVRRADIHHRNFPYRTEQIVRAFGIRQGGESDIFCTLCGAAPVVLFVERLA